MKKVLFILRYRSFIMFLSFILFINCFMYIGRVVSDSVMVSRMEAEEAQKLRQENEKLKQAIDSIMPDESNTIYDDKYRTRYKLDPSLLPVPVSEIHQKGINTNFNIVLDEPEYKRPLYDSGWKDFYFRGWLFMPQKISDARHRLFVYYGGASNIFDFEGSLGFGNQASTDYHRNINFLVYNFKVENIQKRDWQIVLTGEPKRTGVQIVAVKIDDILHREKEEEMYLFQLATREGYEIDRFIGPYHRSKYIEKNNEMQPNAAILTFSEENDNLEQLRVENRLLKEKLYKYIPWDEKRITLEQCRLKTAGAIKAADISEAIGQGKALEFNVNYINKKYKRPVYHPSWKENYWQGWSYIPQKICEGFHDVFVIPEKPGERNDLLGSLAFYESYKAVKNDEVGVLVFNFDVQKTYLYQNQILLIGVPRSEGAQIITFKKKNLNEKDMLLQLITPDNSEVDYDVILN